MSLTSGLFVLFLGAVCALSYVIPRRFRYVFLLVASYAFYLYSPSGFAQNLPALCLLASATLISYFCALALQKSSARRMRVLLLVLSLLSSVGMLAFFKYTDTFFALTGLSDAFSLILPLGMGYYTLQAAGYTLDVYRGKISAERNILRYALFVSFFPAIITGPIGRAGHLLPQYKMPQPFCWDFVSGGLFRMLWGLVKKLVIADNIAVVTSDIFSDTTGQAGPVLLLGILLFAYQLYMDFSGSCDIAIGAARMLGFTLKENFNRPFAAKTYTAFWRRWHISLTEFLRDYVYFPLGGGRVRRFRHVINIMAVFAVSALWHGSGGGEGFWYIICLLSIGLFVSLATLLRSPKERLIAHLPLYRIPTVRGVFQRIWLYLIFSVALVPFVFALYDVPPSDFFTQLTLGWGTGQGLLVPLSGISFSGVALAVLPLSALFVMLVERTALKQQGTIAEWVRTLRWFARWPLYYALILLLLLAGAFGQSAFIYQQF